MEYMAEQMISIKKTFHTQSPWRIQSTRRNFFRESCPRRSEDKEDVKPDEEESRRSDLRWYCCARQVEGKKQRRSDRERQTESERAREADRQRERERERQTDKERQTDIKTDRQTDRVCLCVCLCMCVCVCLHTCTLHAACTTQHKRVEQ
jgi:hypothetical protein